MELVELKKDLRFFTSLKTRSFRIQNITTGARLYPLLTSGATTGRISLGCTAIILSVELTSTWKSDAGTIVLGAAVGLDQGQFITVAGASNLWISHFRQTNVASNGALFNSIKRFQYPFCPRVDANNSIVGYATETINGAADTYEGVATVTYYPIDQ